MTTNQKVKKAKQLLIEAIAEGIDYNQFYGAVYAKKNISKAVNLLNKLSSI